MSKARQDDHLRGSRAKREGLTSFWCSVEQRKIQLHPFEAQAEHLVVRDLPQTTHSPEVEEAVDPEGFEVVGVIERRFAEMSRLREWRTIGCFVGGWNFVDGKERGAQREEEGRKFPQVSGKQRERALTNGSPVQISEKDEWFSYDTVRTV